MMLIEQTTVLDAALPVTELRDYLRLGSGFGTGGVDETALRTCLRAAMATIEARVSKAVLTRTYKWTALAWRDLARQTLPVAPVIAVNSLTIVDMNGTRSAIPAAQFRLEPDLHKPALAASGWGLPTIPVGGFAEIIFDAGFGDTWAEVPSDLAQAVLALAAHYYDDRGAIGRGSDAVPHAVRDVLARYRVVRLFGGL